MLTTEPAEKIQSELQEFGFAIVLPPRDANLALPSTEFLAQLFDWVKDMMPKYAKESWDCDDFAMRMVTEASILLTKLNPGCGHSIFYCTLRIVEGCDLNGIAGGAHATCIVKTSDRGWVFFEPQNGRNTDVKTAMADSTGSLDAVLM